jgi:tripartite ATP-independent transporter DctP family solute receptor
MAYVPGKQAFLEILRQERVGYLFGTPGTARDRSRQRARTFGPTPGNTLTLARSQGVTSCAESWRLAEPKRARSATIAETRRRRAMKTLSVTIALIVGVGLAVARPSEAAIVLKAGHIAPKTSLEGRAADRFAELVEQKTKGAVKVEVYPAQQLGSGQVMIDSTILGNQDIYYGGNSEFERFSKDLRITLVNYVFRDLDHFQKFLRTPIWKKALADPLEKAGLKVISTEWNTIRGPFRVLVSKRPVKSIDDLKGLRLRMFPGDAPRRSWEAMGANVIVLPWGDVYLGLKQGVVEALTSPFDLLYSMKFTEIAKYVARTDEWWQVIAIATNLKRFESLKPDYQNALVDAANEAGLYHRELSEKAVKEDLDRMVKEHNIVYTTLDLKPFVARMAPVIRQFEAEGFLPRGLYDEVQAIK